MEDMQNQLQEVGLKQTKSRLAILEILEAENKPLDVSDLLFSLQRKELDVDTVTVYRILDVFVEKNLVKRLQFQEGKYRYELAGKDHHHLICTSCGDISDISDCGLEEWEKEIFKKKGFFVKQHSLEFFGICKQCKH